MAGNLVEHLVAFCRLLRATGLPVTPESSALAARALDAVDVLDRDDVRLALRSALVARREDQSRFDALFAEYWSASLTTVRSRPTARTRVTRTGAPPVTLATWMRPDATDEGGPMTVRAASAHEVLGHKDLARLDNRDAQDFRALAARIARRLALRRSRRWRGYPRGERIDLRRTVRGSLRTGGDAVELARRTRKLRRTKLVVICDVSASMEPYARFLLQFLHAMQNSFARVDTFVFSTRLTRISTLLRGADWDRALSAMAREVRDWSGGTRIGASLTAFVRRWLSLVDGRTIALVLSDGWETGDPAVLSEAMARIHERAGRVIWLNPLMAATDFEPVAKGMQAVLPHVDLLLPAHDLASLDRLVRHLVVRRGRASTA